MVDSLWSRWRESTPPPRCLLLGRLAPSAAKSHTQFLPTLESLAAGKRHLSFVVALSNLPQLGHVDGNMESDSIEDEGDAKPDQDRLVGGSGATSTYEIIASP